MFDRNRPIYTLTVGEFEELLRELQEQQPARDSKGVQQHQNPQPRRYVYGIGGLARLLGVSNATAQRIKSSGRIDAAVAQEGRSITIDADKVISILSPINATTP